MKSQQTCVAFLLGCILLQHVSAVVNTGPTKNVEEPKNNSETKKDDNASSNSVGDLVAEGSESADRREASISHSYGPPPLQFGSSGHFNLPVPVYGVPNAPSNNVVYPAPPPDIPPPPPKSFPSSLYGAPSFGKTYGVPQINYLPPVSKGYGPPLKYGAPSFSFNQFSTGLVPPKPLYGPPKNVYGPPGKPLKYHKYPIKNFGQRPPKPVYGAPITFKDNFSYNKINNNNFNTNSNSFSSLYTNGLSSNNAYSNLYSGVSSINHQYGAPIIPPKQTIISIQHANSGAGLSTQYGVPGKTIIESPAVAYGPPQPSPNPRPPHPGAPAPPTPPDIKYDGWQPIPGLVAKRPVEEVHHITGEGSGYHGLSPSPLNGGQSHVSDSYGAPPVTFDISHGNNLLDQPGLSDSYGVPLNVGGSKTVVSDSYSAPLGSVTGSGGIVASSGSEAHGGSASVTQTDSHSSSQSLSLDLSAAGIGHSSDIQATKSIEYEIKPQSSFESNSGTSFQLSNSYGAPQPSTISLGNAYASEHSYQTIGSSAQTLESSFNSYGHKDVSLSGSAIRLVPPSGVYGLPPSNHYGTPTHSINHESYRPLKPKRPSVHKDYYSKDGSSFGSSSSNSYLPPSPPVAPSVSYGVPGASSAISYQNVVHGSSTAGIDIHQQSFNIEGANALPLTSYHASLGPIDQSYSISSSGGGGSVGLDYSHPSQTIDLTQGKQLSHDCAHNNQQLQGSSLAYGASSADSYTSSLSGFTTNVAESQSHSVSGLVPPQSHSSLLLSQYGETDLAQSSSHKSEAKLNTIEEDGEAHGKTYGKSVAESFGPNSELVESQSIDLNNIPLQGNLGSYTLQIQSADGSAGPVPHTQVLNDGLLQSILQAIEQPGQQGQNNKYPIILQPSIERNNYSVNETIDNLHDSQNQPSEIREVIVEASKDNTDRVEDDNQEDEETLQLLDTSNIALYYKKDNDMQKVEIEKKDDNNEPEKSSA